MSDDTPETETYNDWEAVCPWCGHLTDDIAEVDIDDGAAVELECGTCQRPMLVEAEICWSYTATRIAGPMTEDEHADAVAAGKWP